MFRNFTTSKRLNVIFGAILSILSVLGIIFLFKTGADFINGRVIFILYGLLFICLLSILSIIPLNKLDTSYISFFHECGSNNKIARFLSNIVTFFMAIIIIIGLRLIVVNILHTTGRGAWTFGSNGSSNIALGFSPLFLLFGIFIPWHNWFFKVLSIIGIGMFFMIALGGVSL